MKKLFRSILLLFCMLTLTAGCASGAEKIQATGAPASSNKPGADKMLIVISAPSVNDYYYTEMFNKIIDFDVQFAKTIIGNDNVVVLADKETMLHLAGRLPDDVLLSADVPDIWVRDFSTARPSKMIQFVYQPKYLPAKETASIQDGFNTFANNLGLKFEHSNLILDGGNVVDNNADMAVVTERVFKDNPGLTKEDIVAQLKQTLDVTHLAIIPEEAGDTTGHADGMVMWLSKDVLLVNKYDEPFRTQVLNALQSELPGVKIIEAPDGYIPNTWKGFDSACGLNINSIVTDKYIYMPVFGQPVDNAFLDIVKQYTGKEVKTVNAENVCIMGGSVRCMSWQVTGENADKLIEAAINK